jgi:hypothetical protein
VRADGRPGDFAGSRRSLRTGSDERRRFHRLVSHRPAPTMAADRHGAHGGPLLATALGETPRAAERRQHCTTTIRASYRPCVVTCGDVFAVPAEDERSMSLFRRCETARALCQLHTAVRRGKRRVFVSFGPPQRRRRRCPRRWNHAGSTSRPLTPEDQGDLSPGILFPRKEYREE